MGIPRFQLQLFSRLRRPLPTLAAGLVLWVLLGGLLAGCSHRPRRVGLAIQEEEARRAIAKEKAARGERTRMQQVFEIDTHQEFNFASVRRNSNRMDARSGIAARNSSMDAQAPVLPQKFRSKAYLTGAYQNRGPQTFWRGDFRYSVTGARLPSRNDPPGKKFDTKAVPAKANAAGEKTYTTAEMPTRDYRGQEAQRMRKPLPPDTQTGGGGGTFELDNGNTGVRAVVSEREGEVIGVFRSRRDDADNAYTGPMHSLNTEADIRALLNKNK